MSGSESRGGIGFDPNAPAFDAVATPALVLDADAMQRNVERMDRFLAARDAWARPHTKTHKSPEIAALQLQQPRTLGICCARLAEAEAMVEAGITELLITSPLTTAEKIRRHVDLVASCVAESRGAVGPRLVVDSELGAARLAAESERRGVRCRVLVDLDPGLHRTGVAMGESALALGRLLAAAPQLELDGLQMYAGHLMHLDNFEERRRRSGALWRQARTTADLFRRAGLECRILTGGGTGTFDIDSEIGIATDLQVGSYVFMDAQYRVIESRGSQRVDASASELSAAESTIGSCDPAAPFDDFEPALFVVAAGVSQPTADWITVDAGLKALASDHVPELIGPPGLRYHFAGDEHGMIDLRRAPAAIGLGDRTALLVSHCDPTVNLHQEYVVVRGGTIVERWPVRARGVA